MKATFLLAPDKFPSAPRYGSILLTLLLDALNDMLLKSLMHFDANHFHYDRFDTPDDVQYGKFSVNSRSNPQGDIDSAVISLDQAEVVFTRKPEALDASLLEKLAGVYLTPSKVRFEARYQPGTGLSIAFTGAPPQKLMHVKRMQFRTPRFADDIYEFVLENGQVKALKERTPSGEYTFQRL